MRHLVSLVSCLLICTGPAAIAIQVPSVSSDHSFASTSTDQGTDQSKLASTDPSTDQAQIEGLDQVHERAGRKRKR